MGGKTKVSRFWICTPSQEINGSIYCSKLIYGWLFFMFLQQHLEYVLQTKTKLDSHMISFLCRNYSKQMIQEQGQTSGAIQYGEPLLDLTSLNFVAWEGKRHKNINNKQPVLGLCMIRSSKDKFSDVKGYLCQPKICKLDLPTYINQYISTLDILLKFNNLIEISYILQK